MLTIILHVVNILLTLVVIIVLFFLIRFLNSKLEK